MALDDDLLAQVEHARTRLERLESEVVDARGLFNQSIRALHAAGGSMREIATALGMSHQRVHQIIGEDAIVEVETSSTDITPHPSSPVAVTADEDACSFCGAPRRELHKLLAAPGRVFICDACVSRACEGQELLDPTGTCSFCRREVSEAFVEGATSICRTCTETCTSMISPEKGRRTVMKRKNSLVRCSFCNVSQKDTAKLIAGPGVYICGECVAVASEVAATSEPKASTRATLRPAATERHACSFCGKRAPGVDEIVKGPRARICNECVGLCEDILAEEMGPPIS